VPRELGQITLNYMNQSIIAKVYIVDDFETFSERVSLLIIISAIDRQNISNWA